jgi:photosystem II stability/assembly factor-like uncharacterized protein
MKYISTRMVLAFALAMPLFMHAQENDWMRELPVNCSFEQIRNAFYEHMDEDRPQVYGKETAGNEEYLQFKRWEYFMRTRIDSTGHFPSEQLWKEYNRSRSSRNSSEQLTASNWTFVGPASVPNYGGGMGRINTMEFNPSNPNTIWIGSANGGLWKTTNGGQSWTSNTDFLPAIGIADIAIDPVDTMNMYIATGDGYGYEAGGWFWGGTYTSGVMKSTDGGQTWNSTGLNYTMTANNIVQRLIIDPANPQVLIAAARDGVWRTADGGTTWTQVSTTHMYDLEINTANDSIIYGSGGTKIYRSADMGLTWSTLATGIGTGGRISIGVTMADSSVIYALSENGNVFRSGDGGNTFQFQSAPGITFYGYYDAALGVSPVNANEIVVGGLEINGSVDGGVSWFPRGNWYGWPGPDYVHADNHTLQYHPTSGSTLFACNDGGIFKSTNGGGYWSNLSSGISISQYYRLAGYEPDTSIVYMGQQDNGVVRRSAGNVYDMVRFADGMESVVDYTNYYHVITSTQNGDMQVSNDGGSSWMTVTPATYASWCMPIRIDDADPNTYYAGYDDIWESNDQGYNWVPISTNLLSGNTIDQIALAPGNNNYIYAANISEIVMTTDHGSTWTNISAGLPFANNSLTGIAVSDKNPLHVWVTFSGFVSGKKVYYSADGGTTWTNYSGSLPNIPVDAIVYQKGGYDDILYIGTDFGVFYRNGTMGDWIPFSNNLPNVIVDDLEINYGKSILRAATYGRGLWQTRLQDPVSVNELPQQPLWSVFPNPSKGAINLTGKLDDLKKVTITNVMGEVVYASKTGSFTNSNNYFTIDLSTQSPGIYFVQMESEQARSTVKVVISH